MVFYDVCVQRGPRDGGPVWEEFMRGRQQAAAIAASGDRGSVWTPMMRDSQESQPQESQQQLQEAFLKYQEQLEQQIQQMEQQQQLQLFHQQQQSQLQNQQPQYQNFEEMQQVHRGLQTVNSSQLLYQSSPYHPTEQAMSSPPYGQSPLSVPSPPRRQEHQENTSGSSVSNPDGNYAEGSGHNGGPSRVIGPSSGFNGGPRSGQNGSGEHGVSDVSLSNHPIRANDGDSVQSGKSSFRELQTGTNSGVLQASRVMSHSSDAIARANAVLARLEKQKASYAAVPSALHRHQPLSAGEELYTHHMSSRADEIEDFVGSGMNRSALNKLMHSSKLSADIAEYGGGGDGQIMEGYEGGINGAHRPLGEEPSQTHRSPRVARQQLKDM